MNNLKKKFQEIMRGRNGADELSCALCVAGFVLMLLSSVLPGTELIYTIGLAAMIYCFIRMFSKDIAKRRAENSKYVNFIKGRKTTKTQKTKKVNNKKIIKEKLKTHEMFKCPKCNANCFVPKNKGKVRITCPKCEEKFLGET